MTQGNQWLTLSMVLLLALLLRLLIGQGGSFTPAPGQATIKASAVPDFRMVPARSELAGDDRLQKKF